MKKKSQGQETIIKSVKLYRDDLNEILTLIQPLCKTIQISDSEFDYDSIEELETKKGQEIKDLTLSIPSPLFSFKISKGQSKLIRGGDTETIAPYVQILALLKNRRRPIFELVFNPFFFIPLVGLIFLLINFIEKKQLIPDILLILLSVAVLLLMFLPFTIHHSSGFSRVFLFNKHEEKSFWTRNRDAIIITIITNIVTALLTFLVAYLLFKQGIK